MALPTDYRDTQQGDQATFTPTLGTAIEFDVLSINGFGGFSRPKGAEITASSDFDPTTGQGTAKFAENKKIEYKDGTMEIKTSKTQLLALATAGRGELVITYKAGGTFTWADVDISDVDVGGGSTKDSEQVVTTVTVSPSGKSAPVNA